MAYSRKSYKRGGRRRGRRSTSWFNTSKFTPGKAYALATQAAKDIWYLKGLVNSEKFHLDTTFSAASIVNTGAVTHLSAIAQGDTVAGRTGNSILLRSLAYRFKLEINSSVSLDTSICMIILQDTQQIADTAPGVTDILTSANPESLLNVTTTSGRFKILKRKTWILTPATGGKPALEIKDYIKFRTHLKYNGTASSDIQKNGLYVLFISSESTNYPTISGTFRIAYHDN